MHRRHAWEEELKKTQCSMSNLICISHFKKEDLDFKSKKYQLKFSAVPTIFVDSIDVQTKKNDLNEVGTDTESQSKLELLNINTKKEKKYKETIDLQRMEIQHLKSRNEELETNSMSYNSSLAQFAIRNDENVNLSAFLNTT